jgi:hypothetical protein
MKVLRDHSKGLGKDKDNGDSSFKNEDIFPDISEI